MEIFDCHSDMFIDITKKRMRGEHDIIKKYHKNQLQQGDVQAMICGVWIDPPNADKPMSRMMEVLGESCDELREANDYVGIAYNAEDIVQIQNQHKLAIILGMEGLSGLKGNVSFISALYSLGVRHAMLTWNEENEFATGVGSIHTDRGITDLGIKALSKMETLGMLIDVSHSNEKTFWDIYNNTNKPFIASHSNAYHICPVPRNLKDEQIKAIAERGGVIGMNTWPEFIDLQHPSVETLANHVDYIAELVGIDHIACGFDFCDYLENDSLSFCNHQVKPTKGIENAAVSQNFLTILEKRGYTQSDMQKIAYKNIFQVITNVIH